MILFDELGLAERSKKNPLKVLHSKLEYKEKRKGISFVGISNYSLDAAKINRALVLSVPDLDQRLDEIILTSNSIVESISEKLINEKVFEILSNTYFNYKIELNFIKELVVYKKYKNEVKRKPSYSSKIITVPINNDIPRLKGELTGTNINNNNFNNSNVNIDNGDNAQKIENNLDISESETESKISKENEPKKNQNNKNQRRENERERRDLETIKMEKEY